jgi:hypothetical protein
MAAVLVPVLASIPAWRCPPFALCCCFFPVVRALGGSHVAAILCAERSSPLWRRFFIVSAESGSAELGLLLWRSPGAQEQITFALLVFGAACTQVP